MSTPSTTATTTTTPTVRSRPASPIGAVSLVLGSVTSAALLLLTPWGERNEIGYAAVAPIRDAFWAGILLDGLAMVAVTLGLSLVVLRLVQRAGAVPARLGAVLAVAGGVTFALGGFGYATLAWHVTDPSILDPAAGTAVLQNAIENPQRSLVVQIVGFLTMTLGVVLLSVALLRSGVLPRWVPIVVLVTSVLAFVVPPRIKDLAQVVQMLAFVALGLLSLRATREAQAATIDR